MIVHLDVCAQCVFTMHRESCGYMDECSVCISALKVNICVYGCAVGMHYATVYVCVCVGEGSEMDSGWST